MGVNYDVTILGIGLSFAGYHALGGPAPVRRSLPELIQLVWGRKIDPGKVFDMTLPLSRRPKATRPWTSTGPRRYS